MDLNKNGLMDPIVKMDQIVKMDNQSKLDNKIGYED